MRTTFIFRAVRRAYTQTANILCIRYDSANLLRIQQTVCALYHFYTYTCTLRTPYIIRTSFIFCAVDRYSAHSLRVAHLLRAQRCALRKYTYRVSRVRNKYGVYNRYGVRILSANCAQRIVYLRQSFAFSARFYMSFADCRLRNRCGVRSFQVRSLEFLQ